MLLAMILVLWYERMINNKEGGIALAYSVTIWLACIYIITELLSVGNHLSKNNILISWIIIDVILVIFFVCQIKKADLIQKNKQKFLICRTVVGALFICFAVVMISFSLHVVPFNWDSMTFRLTRIINWAHNNSVAHYASDVSRCISEPVLSEFVGLHIFQLYVGTQYQDSLMNLTQTLSYIVSTLFVYNLARKIGSTFSFACLASLLFLSTPIVFSESITTQNDLFSTVVFFAFVNIIIELAEDNKNLVFDRNAILSFAFLGISSALCYLTKYNILMYMAPIVVVAIIMRLYHRDKVVNVIRLSLITIFVFIIMILPEMVRNIKTFGQIFPDLVGPGQVAHTFKPKYLFILFLKNFTRNAPSANLPWIGEALYSFMDKICQLLGVDMNDLSITMDANTAFFYAQPNDYSCDAAVNPTITFAIFISFILFLIIVNMKKDVSKQKKMSDSNDNGDNISGLNHLWSGRIVNHFSVGIVALTFLICYIMEWNTSLIRHSLPICIFAFLLVFIIAFIAETLISCILKKKIVCILYPDKIGYRVYLLGIIGLVIFCVFAIWTPYRVRYEVPIFAFLSVGIIYIIQQCCTKGSILSKIGCSLSVILFFLSVTTIINLFYYNSKFLYRNDADYALGYYRYDVEDDVYKDYEIICNSDAFETYQTIGITTYEDYRHYPLLRKIDSYGKWIQYVNVDNETSIYEDTNNQPDCILALGIEIDESTSYECHGRVYHNIIKLKDGCYYITQ